LNDLTGINSQSRSTSAPPTINVTPLVDVLLVLLIIFFVIQPRKEAKLPVTAPNPAPENAQPSPETLMLVVSNDSRLALNSKPVELDELIPLLAVLMQQRPTDLRTLLIKAPPRVSYESIVSLIDLTKGAGVITIGLLAGD
jgi:biopolymer transport protein TolR